MADLDDAEPADPAAWMHEERRRKEASKAGDRDLLRVWGRLQTLGEMLERAVREVIDTSDLLAQTYSPDEWHRMRELPPLPEKLDVDNLKNALEHIRLAAGLHYFGGAFRPEHMRSIANLASRALLGDPIPPMPDPEEVRAKTESWAVLFAEEAEDEARERLVSREEVEDDGSSG